MNRQTLLTLLVAAVFFNTGFIAAGDEPTAVLEKGNQLRQLLRDVAKYPPELRRAAVVVCQNPKLLGKLYDATQDASPFAAVNETLASYSKEVQDAGKLLAKSPEILEVLILHTPLCEMIGQAYTKLGEAKLKEVIAELQKETADTEQSVDKWAKRLGGNKVALAQFLSATSAYVAEARQEGHRDYGLGVAVSDKNQAVVYSLPAAPLTAYVLVNADVYPELADEMVEQWLTTNSLDDFDDVLAQYWFVVSQHFRADILQPKGRAERLVALAKLGKKLGEERMGKPATIEDRMKFLNAHAAEYPEIASLHEEKPSAPPKPGPDGHIKIEKPKMPRKVAPSTTVANTTTAHTTVANATPPPVKDTRPVPETVSQGSPSTEQQVRRTASNQTYQFNVYSPQIYNNAATNPYQGYYPGYMGFAPVNPYFYSYAPGVNPWMRSAAGVGGVGFGRPGGAGFMSRPIGGGGRGRR